MYRSHIATALLLAIGCADAQGPRNQWKGGMLGPGMGPGVGPGMPSGMGYRVGLPQMKAELGFSAQQDTQLWQFKGGTARFRRETPALRQKPADPHKITRS